MYDILFLEENDNIRIIFDRFQLINDLISLYEQIQITINVINTDIKVSQTEKDMIMNILKNDLFKKKDNSNIQTFILNIIHNVKEIELNKLKISEVKLDDKSDNYFSILLTPDYELKPPMNPDINLFIPNPYVSLNNEAVSNTNIEYSIKSFNDPNGGIYDKNYSDLIMNWWNENKLNPIKNSYCILYNQDNECSLLCNYTHKIKSITTEFNDFLILKEYNNISDKSIEILKELINKNLYCEKEEFKKKLDAFESLYDIKNINEKENEKSLIIYYIKQHYNISSDVSKRIKINVLIKEIENELNINNTNLKYHLANYLYEIGLQKKRYSDGMYLYGIESKLNSKITDINKTFTPNDYDNLIISRMNDLDDIFNSYTQKPTIKI